MSLGNSPTLSTSESLQYAVVPKKTTKQNECDGDAEAHPPASESAVRIPPAGHVQNPKKGNKPDGDRHEPITEGGINELPPPLLAALGDRVVKAEKQGDEQTRGYNAEVCCKNGPKFRVHELSIHFKILPLGIVLLELDQSTEPREGEDGIA